MSGKVILGVCAAAGLSFLAGTALAFPLTPRRYRIGSAKIKSPVRLILLSDLHGAFYGKGQGRLLEEVKAQKPDFILFAGDMMEGWPEPSASLLFNALGTSYPCFYVTGNHEYGDGLDSCKALARSCGVTVLEGTCRECLVRGQPLIFCGVDDPAVFGWNPSRGLVAEGPGWQAQLDACAKAVKKDTFSILLSHHPERIGRYRAAGFDLTLCGHAHGGQVRIPSLLNGLYAPGQGLFPKYAGGLYSFGDCAMVVGRGLSKNRFPRVYNPPELVVIDLVPARQ